MTRLRRLYGRASISKLEMNILRGILTETQKRRARRSRSGGEVMLARMREDIRCVFQRDPAARTAFEVLTC